MRRIASLVAIAAALLVAASAARALSPFFLFFDPGSARLSADSLAILDNAARAVERLDTRRVEIEAHTDRAGAAAANLALALRRAEAVRDALVARGVRPEILTLVARGEAEPLVETADGVAEPQNRFVAIIMVSICRLPPDFEPAEDCRDD